MVTTRPRHAGEASADAVAIPERRTRAVDATKTVKLRGKVVKFVAQIMGTNWLHVQDGSGEGGTADLTVTTDAMVKVGDVVEIEGPLTVNKDFGAGYKYAAIIEKATVTKK